MAHRSKRQPRKYALVMVEWDDASGSAAWRDSAEAKRFKMAPCVSVGWLLVVSKKRLVIAASWNSDNHDVSDVTAIPAGWVVSVRELRQGKART